jgi:hypothetical protein
MHFPNRIKITSDSGYIHAKISNVQILRFRQRCNREFCSSGMWSSFVVSMEKFTFVF